MKFLWLKRSWNCLKTSDDKLERWLMAVLSLINLDFTAEFFGEGKKKRKKKKKMKSRAVGKWRLRTRSTSNSIFLSLIKSLRSRRWFMLRGSSRVDEMPSSFLKVAQRNHCKLHPWRASQLSYASYKNNQNFKYFTCHWWLISNHFLVQLLVSVK